MSKAGCIGGCLEGIHDVVSHSFDLDNRILATGGVISKSCTSLY